MGVTSQVLRKDKRFGQIKTQNVTLTVDEQFRACAEVVEVLLFEYPRGSCGGEAGRCC